MVAHWALLALPTGGHSFFIPGKIFMHERSSRCANLLQTLDDQVVFWPMTDQLTLICPMACTRTQARPESGILTLDETSRRKYKTAR